jgi:hypothetical protein
MYCPPFIKRGAIQKGAKLCQENEKPEEVGGEPLRAQLRFSQQWGQMPDEDALSY